MKKLYALAAAALVGLAATAQNGAPLYILGAGDFSAGEWNEKNPDEFVYADGKYTVEIANLTQFKISTQKGSWSEFDAGVLGCSYGNTPGVAVALQRGNGSNIQTPWKGDYTITVTGDLSTITLTTETQEVKEPIVLYLRGSMNDWKAEADWMLVSVVEDRIFKYPESGSVSLKSETEFKIADADWNKYNIGGIGDWDFNKQFMVANGGNPANFYLNWNFDGVIWLNLDIDGAPYLLMSTDETFVPAWEGLESSVVTEIEISGDAAPRYFNLQGIEVANPERGFYIVSRGNKVTKELIYK